MIKRWSILIITIISICFLLTGCANNGVSQKESNQSEKIVNVITFANWNPFEYISDGNIVGFDIDLINAVAKEAGYQCKITNVGWEALFQQLKDNSADVAISGITATDERKQTYDFSKPYFISKEAILTSSDSTIQSIEDFKTNGKTIALQNGSTAQVAVEKILGVNNPNVKKTTLQISRSMLLSGQVDALVGDVTTLKPIVQEHSDKNLKIIYDDTAFEPEYFSIMYPKNSKVKEDFNIALQKLIDNGTYTELYKKWFKTEPDINALKQNIN